jgi:surface antigen
MRIAAIAGLFACGIVFTAASSSVNAEASLLTINSSEKRQLTVQIMSSATTLVQEELAVSGEFDETAPVVHEITNGETLITIAKQYQTTWKALFNKNEHISHPDVISVGDKITIPAADEELNQRPLPELLGEQISTAQQSASATGRSGAVAARSAASEGPGAEPANSSGNRYVRGYCTWYAKNRRPDLPNNLGNANTWVSRASAQGLSTGSTPRVGAIGQQGMHVVYVESVNEDGTVTVSEMNFRGLHVISSRTVPASTFRYIY